MYVVCVCVCMGMYVFVCILCLTNCQIACAVAGEISGLFNVHARVESHIRVQKVHYVVVNRSARIITIVLLRSYYYEY